VYTYRGDGKDNPISGGRGTPLMIAITAVDTYTVSYAQKLPDGRVVTTGRRALAKDGKNMTITATGTNAQGQNTSSPQSIREAVSKKSDRSVALASRTAAMPGRGRRNSPATSKPRTLSSRPCNVHISHSSRRSGRLRERRCYDRASGGSR
jgi:hypothetical protein